MDEKSKDGVANFLLFVGALLIIAGTYIAFDMQEYRSAAFICLLGTICSLVSNYIKHGYFKFFN